MDMKTDFLYTAEGFIFSIRIEEDDENKAIVRALNGGEPLKDVDDARRIVTQLNLRKKYEKLWSKKHNEIYTENQKLRAEIKKLKAKKRKGKV